MSLIQSSLMEQKNALDRKEISSLELTELHIKHIERINPDVNAMVAFRFQEAAHGKYREHSEQT